MDKDSLTITGGFRTVESADTVKAEAISTVVGAMENGWWRITSHWFTCTLQPGAILCTLALKSTSERNKTNLKKKLYETRFQVEKTCNTILFSPFGFIGNMVAWLAFVLAERANF